MGSMKCVIPGVNLKVFGRAIQSLSKIGDELYIEPLEDGFTPSFFSDYIDATDDDNGKDNSEKDGLRCKLGMKSVLTVFRNLSTIDKTVERCKISWQTKEAKMVFQLHCRHGIVKTHNLFFMESETLQAVFFKDLSPNKLTAEPKLLCDAVLNFQAYQEEVTLIVRPDFVALKNYVEDESNPSRVIHTELTLLPDEFDHFQVGVDTDITFCLKEFRAVLAFADVTSLPLSLHFEGAGRPLTFAITSDTSFVADFVLATLADDGNEEDGGVSTQNAEHRSKNPPRHTASSNTNKSKMHRKGKGKSKGMSSSSALRRNAAEDEEDGDMELAMMDIQDASMAEHRNNDVRSTNSNNTQRNARDNTSNPNTGKWQNSGCAVMSNSEECRRNVAPPESENQAASSSGAVNERLQQVLPSSSSSQRAVVGTSGFHSDRLKPVKSFPRSTGNNNRADWSQVENDSGQTQAGRLPKGHHESDEDEDNVSPVIPFVSNANTRSNPSLIKSMASLDDHEDAVVSEEDDDDEKISGTPPSKKFRSLFFGTQSSTQSSKPSQENVTVLAPDSDCDD